MSRLELASAPLLVASCGFAAALAGLRLVPSTAQLPLSGFEPAPIECGEERATGTLLLTPEMALAADAAEAERANDETGELLLEDALEPPEQEARVVRLFGAQTVPTRGELRETVESHPRTGEQRCEPPDAFQALSDALAQLRRTLR